MIKIKRALISCWNKDGIGEFAARLQAMGVDIISSGGTARHLSEQGVKVVKVADVTGYPEVLGGRVKTLHPRIHAAILSANTPDHLKDLEEIGTEPIQLVVVNLYPFVAEAVSNNLEMDKAIEFIDIGGPTMLRAAAKNYQHVVSLHEPRQYQALLDEMAANDGSVTTDFSRARAREVFFYTSWYDGQIQSYFGDRDADEGAFSQYQTAFLVKKEDLRYGENPHQLAAVYEHFGATVPGLAGIEQLWGKPLSFNNYVDVNAAYALALEFTDKAVAIIKHTNPCGAAVSDDSITDAFRKALRGDSLSAFGGIVAANSSITLEMAEAVKGIFFECVIAPDFDQAALELLQKKKNLRLLKLDPERYRHDWMDYKEANGAVLIQQADQISEVRENWKVATERQPTAEEWKELEFSWILAKHVKSNAIVVTRNREVYGVGAGQMSRVDAVQLACIKARQAERDLGGTVLASDAFFPFRDGVDKAVAEGITAIIQPGGSIRDEEVIAAANEHGISMVLTGIRHFKH